MPDGLYLLSYIPGLKFLYLNEAMKKVDDLCHLGCLMAYFLRRVDVGRCFDLFRISLARLSPDLNPRRQCGEIAD